MNSRYKFDLQFFGGGTKTRRVRTRDPEPTELTTLRNNIYSKVNQGLQSYDPASWRKEMSGNLADAEKQANVALDQQNKLLSQLPGTMDQNNAILSEMLGVTRTGNIPSQLSEAMNSSVNKSLQGSMGNMLSNLSNRGVLNSSVTGQGISRLGQQAADAYNQNYLNAYNSVIGNYAKALQGSQGNTGAMLSSIGALGQIPNQAYQQANAKNSLSPNSLGSTLSPALQFWQGWQNSYDNRNDYDTIVRQGK